MKAHTSCLALLLAAAPVFAGANVTSVLPAGPVPDAAILAAPTGPTQRANWYRAATPDVSVEVDTEQDREHPFVIVTYLARDVNAGHVIERADTPTGPWSEIAMLPYGHNRTTDRSLQTTQKYFYRVIAINGTMRSLPSTVVEVDLPSILSALEVKIPAGASRKPLGRRKDPDQYDSDGTAAFLVLMLVRSAFGRKRV